MAPTGNPVLAAMVDKLITQNKVVIFSKTTCPFCDRVKELFTSLNIPYEALELDTIEGGPAIQDLLAGKPLFHQIINVSPVPCALFMC